MLNVSTSRETPEERSAPSSEPRAPHLCENSGCHNLVSDCWDPEGRLCGRCALDAELFDREKRWARVFPAAYASVWRFA